MAEMRIGMFCCTTMLSEMKLGNRISVVAERTCNQGKENGELVDVFHRSVVWEEGSSAVRISCRG